MGAYLNCGNDAFRMIRNDNYVDKTGLIGYVNNTIDKPRNLICVSRPRRFGKSYAAMMLSAYYDRSCDSHSLFDDLEISREQSYEEYINRFDVIYLDITLFLTLTERMEDVISCIQQSVIGELTEAFPGCVKEGTVSLPAALLSINQKAGNRFIIIVDEWDALFREAKQKEYLQGEYLRLLRGLFKGGPAMKKAVAGAYMTGILPIKKYGTESALTDSREFTMTDPDMLAPYVGFTESEVHALCEKHGMDFDEMKQWYDGYSFSVLQSVYSPNSVMTAIERRVFRSYWKKTETYESLKNYITANRDGLKDAIVSMLGGIRVQIDTGTFQNDMISMKSRDDILTLLIHLGYLSYDEQESAVRIPNLEIADAFRTAVKETGWAGVSEALAESDKLLKSTIAGDSDAVADVLENIHSASCSVLEYNDENSLSCALTIAYYTAQNYYNIVREFPAGKGFADLAFIPYKNVDKPAMIVELKYDKSADAAIRQIKEKRYDGALRNYGGELLLVGINYNSKNGSKKHECVIERYQ
ncbi:MAG: ATP-binding protein [Clostridiales bacterium]|nr:ATP-binding protein [Clostridiales bacterium]